MLRTFRIAFAHFSNQPVNNVKWMSFLLFWLLLLPNFSLFRLPTSTPRLIYVCVYQYTLVIMATRAMNQMNENEWRQNNKRYCNKYYFATNKRVGDIGKNGHLKLTSIVSTRTHNDAFCVCLCPCRGTTHFYIHWKAFYLIYWHVQCRNFSTINQKRCNNNEMRVFEMSKWSQRRALCQSSTNSC